MCALSRLQELNKEWLLKYERNVLRAPSRHSLFCNESIRLRQMGSFMGANGQSGFGLVEAIITITLGVVGLVALNSGVLDAKKSSRRVESDIDLSSIRNNLQQSVSCSRTFAGRVRGNPCPAGQYIDLKTVLDKTLLAQNGSRIGHWVVRAYCDAPGAPGAPDGGLDIRALGILPASDGVAEARDWKSGVPDPGLFRRDELTLTPYNADHPKAKLFAVTTIPLCSDWFGTPSDVGNCSNPNQFVKSIDFENESMTCGTVPSCTGTQVLNFDGTDFSCSNSLNTILTTRIDTIRTAVTTTMDTHVTNLSDSLNYVNGRFATLGLGAFTEVLGTNNSQCQSLRRMRCPDGYMMWAYEARIEPDHNCRVQCRKIVP